MNGVLFRRSARSLWKTWVVFAAVLSLYVSMITAMFDPKLNATLDEIVTAMPQLMNMVGMQAGSSSLGGFLINYLYGFLLLLLPLVFSILAANRLVARWVDTGSMAYLLVSPNTRARVARTQALVLIAGGTLLTAYCTALAVGCAAAMFPGELDVPAYLVVNAGLLEVLQRDYQVNVAGPSTMAALLNSLQMGFKTLAIQKRSGEVWQLLGAVKTEFDKFGQGLSKMQQRLRQTDEELDNLIGVRSRAISRKLRAVQTLDENTAATLLELDTEPGRPVTARLPESGEEL